jgi:acrylyl-CoA reductase (NADPH)
VAPFILRGITLYGIDSVMAPLAKRQAAWARLAKELDLAKLESLTQEIPLAAAVQAGSDILAGKVRGRLVVNVNA